MLKPLSLSLAVAVTLTGCAAFRKSQTWEKVVENRSDRIAARGGDYTNELHKVLTSDNVEHKVVTYEYRYRTRLREEAVDTRTAVIYRDATTPNYPWWIMDEHLSTPRWLPNGEVDRQVQFFIGAPAQVLTRQDFPGDGSGSSKATEHARRSAFLLARSNRPAPVQRSSRSVMLAAVKPQPSRTRALVRTAPTSEVAARPLFARAEPQAQRASAPLAARIKPAGRPVVFAPKSSQPSASPRFAASFDRTFRNLHGTSFDQSSSRDRQKMSELREAFLLRNPRLSQRSL
jgi:hypothetical protein